MSSVKNPMTWPARDNFIKTVFASKLRDKQARVLARLAMFLNIEEGKLDPSCSTLAKASGVSERSVYRILEALERIGWIEIERTLGSENRYILRYPTTATHMAGVTTATHMAVVDAATTAKSSTEPLPNRAATTANKVADKKQVEARGKARGKISLSRSRARERDLSPGVAARGKGSKQGDASEGSKNRAASDDGFSRFWAVYPRHDSEEPARKRFATAVQSGVDADVIIAGAKVYALAEQMRLARPGQSAQHTLMAKNWLRDRKWNDPLPPGAVIDNATGAVVAIEQEEAEEETSLNDEWMERIYGPNRSYPDWRRSS